MLNKRGICLLKGDPIKENAVFNAAGFLVIYGISDISGAFGRIPPEFPESPLPFFGLKSGWS